MITQSFFIVGKTKKMKIWGFRALKTGRNFWVYVCFWRIFLLQRPLENFLEVIHICLKYLKDAPNSGLCNAPTLVVIRHRNHFLSCRTVNPPPVTCFGNDFFICRYTESTSRSNVWVSKRNQNVQISLLTVKKSCIYWYN